MAVLARNAARYDVRFMPLDVVRKEGRRWMVVRGTGCVNLPEVITLIQTARAHVEHQMWPMLAGRRRR